MFERLFVGFLNGKDKVCDHLTEGAGSRITPFYFTKVTRITSSDINNGSVTHDAAMFAKGLVEFAGGGNINSNDEVYIVVAVGESEVIFREGGFVRSDENLDEVAFELVTEMVGFVLVERNDEILEAVGIGFKSLSGLEKSKTIGNTARIDGGRVFLNTIKKHSKTDGGGDFVDGWFAR